MITERTLDERADGGQWIVPIVGLTDNLSTSAIEQLTVDALKRYRCLVAAADQAFQEWQTHQLGVTDGDTNFGEPKHMAYVAAMIDLHAQQLVLSTLLDILGYVPPAT